MKTKYHIHKTCRSSMTRFVFRKVDVETGSGLVNAVFQLVRCKCNCNNTILTARSDAQGFVEFCSLCPGDYLLSELIPPENYTPNNTRFLIRIDCGGCIFVNGELVDNFTISNISLPILTRNFNIYKTNPDGVPLSGAVYELFQDGVVIQTVATNDVGIADFFEIPLGRYTLVETQAPFGYIPNTTVYNVIVTESIITINDVVTDVLSVVNEPIVISISGVKVWQDNDNAYATRPLTVIIALYQDGIPYRTTEISAFSSGAFTFSNLPQFAPSGIEHMYTVDETASPAGYIKSVFGTTITNTLEVTVMTGTWYSYGNYLASIVDSSFIGYFDTSVIESGIRYAYNDPTLASPMTASSGTITSPFSTWITDLRNGVWYYGAYIRTADGIYHYGDTKMATYP